MNIFQETFEYNGQSITIETGKMAKQCTSSLTIQSGKTTILVTVVAADEAAENPAFFPLSVHYQEKYYAAGKIPGGFFKREAKPSEKEVLISRLIDRSIRPLFPSEYMNEIQILCTVLSSHKDEDTDILSMLGVSAALAISPLPFEGPIAAAKIAYLNNQYLINPKRSQLKNSILDMVVSGTKDAVMMVESGASELSETVMLGAIEQAHTSIQQAISAIESLASKINPTKLTVEAKPENTALDQIIAQDYQTHIAQIFQTAEKMERQKKLKALQKSVLEKIQTDHPEKFEPQEIKKSLSKHQKNHLRSTLLNGGPRIDGRDCFTVRPIESETSVLPCAHGSVLFTRGETQALVTTTLAPLSSGQLIDDLEDARHDHFMLHYNFPGFCVGEIKPNMGPKRREIGHGRLARRAIESMLPDQQSFPYTIRVVSEILESNGSSSMATVCGASMSLMDAGVPMKGPVAGIAMGLIKEEDNVKILTDILGDEDYLGDMDFKVAGSAMGITALQMDIKIKGISIDIMKEALTHAKQAREHILSEMSKTIEAAKADLPEGAPQIRQFQISPQKISALIGKGGSNIKKIIEEYQVEVDVEQDGSVKIYGLSLENVKLAEKAAREYVFEPTVGKIYTGKVKNITNFGAFVEIAPNVEGLLHISEIADERIEDINEYLEVSETVNVKLLQVDDKGRLKLSMRQADSVDFSD